MIKVLVADDEKIVHHGLQALANWEEYGFSLCYDAYNGAQALEVLRNNPDIRIVLTDLQMPKMNGLQFLEELQKQGSDVKVIVLSAHDSYDLIRQAFKLNVSDYIIKSQMTKDEILKQLQNVAAQLTVSKNTPSNFGEKDKAQLREKYLIDLLKNMNTEPTEKYSEILGIDRAYTFFSAVCVLMDNHPKIDDRLALLRSLTNDISTNNLFMEIAAITPTELGILFAFKNKHTGTKEGKLNNALHMFRSRLENYMNINITIGVSNVVSKIEQVGNQYDIARENADMRFVLGKGTIIFPSDAKNIVSYDIGSIAGHTRKLIDALRESNTPLLMDELEQMFITIRQYNPKNIEQIFPHYMEVIFAIMRYLDEIGLDTVDLFRRNVNFYSEIQKFTTRDELNNWTRNIVRWISEHLKERENEDLNRPIVMAREFIKKNYVEKSLSLSMVSEYVGLSENHFSSIFAKQTGKTFTEYVTELRIEKAKTLLRETNLKVYEVAENVGFANAEYFSKIFKKTTRKSPNQFLKSNVKELIL